MEHKQTQVSAWKLPHPGRRSVSVAKNKQINEIRIVSHGMMNVSMEGREPKRANTETDVDDDKASLWLHDMHASQVGNNRKT